MSFITDEIRKLIRCAHCLNHGATNQVSIEGKAAPNGQAKDADGQAVAYMCDDHKNVQPRFAHQIVGDNVNHIMIEQLQDISPPPPPPAPVEQPKPIIKETDENWKYSKEEQGDEEA